jgi:hypothetical protein
MRERTGARGPATPGGAQPRHRPARAPRLPAGTRREPASLRVALWRAVVVRGGVMANLVASVVVFTLCLLPALANAGTDPYADSMWWAILHVLSTFWILGVWFLGDGRARNRVEPLPVGALAQQLTRVAAGAVWLELAVLLVVAGTFSGMSGWPRPAMETAPAWAAARIALGALGAYLLASIPVLMARTWAMAMLAVLWTAMAISFVDSLLPRDGLSPSHVLGVSRHTGQWSAMLLWTAIVAALAVAAAAHGAAKERRAIPASR